MSNASCRCKTSMLPLPGPRRCSSPPRSMPCRAPRRRHGRGPGSQARARHRPSRLCRRLSPASAGTRTGSARLKLTIATGEARSPCPKGFCPAAPLKNARPGPSGRPGALHDFLERGSEAFRSMPPGRRILATVIGRSGASSAALYARSESPLPSPKRHAGQSASGGRRSRGGRVNAAGCGFRRPPWASHRGNGRFGFLSMPP